MLDRCLASLPGAAGGLTGLAVSKDRVCIFLGMGGPPYVLFRSLGLGAWGDSQKYRLPHSISFLSLEESQDQVTRILGATGSH